MSAASLTDDQNTVYTMAGLADAHATGLAKGPLILDGGPGALVVREAHVLTSTFTIAGAGTVLGQVGPVTLVA